MGIIHTFFFGILIGLGVAMPLGPINIEMMRRNLQFGFRYGFSVGVGATFADVTYIILMVSGVLTILHSNIILKIIGIIGSLILCWFAYKAFTMKIIKPTGKEKKYGIWHCITSGYLVALLSPYNLLFWISLTSQFANLSSGNHYSMISSILGVIFGAIFWVVALNIMLSFTHKYLSNKIIYGVNILGGLILISFAAYGFIHAIIN